MMIQCKHHDNSVKGGLSHFSISHRMREAEGLSKLVPRLLTLRASVDPEVKDIWM